MSENKKTGKKPATKKYRLDSEGRECTVCGVYKAWDEYTKDSTKPNGRHSRCQACNRSMARAYYEANAEKCRSAVKAYKDANPEKVKAAVKTWYAVNRDRVAANHRIYRDANQDSVANKQKEWREANTERYRESKRRNTKTYRLANPDKIAELSQKRRSSKIHAIPSWADHTAIAEIFKESRRLAETTGSPYHVDHIIPLQHQIVCGLHVPSNLIPVPARVNLSKSNRFDPDLYAACETTEDYYTKLLGI